MKDASTRDQNPAYSTSSCGISEMLIDLLERGDVAFRAVPVDQQAANAGRAGAHHVLLSRIADVQRIGRLAAGELERALEDPRVWLSRAGLGGGDRPIEQLAEPASVEHPRQRAIPVRDHDQPQATIAKAAQGRDRVRIGGEADRGDQLVDADVESQLPGDEGRAALAELGEGRIVASLM